MSNNNINEEEEFDPIVENLSADEYLEATRTLDPRININAYLTEEQFEKFLKYLDLIERLLTEKRTTESASAIAIINESRTLALMQTRLFEVAINKLLVGRLGLNPDNSRLYIYLALAIPYALYVDKHIMYVTHQVAALCKKSMNTVYTLFTRFFKNPKNHPYFERLREKYGHSSNTGYYEPELCLHLLCMEFLYILESFRFCYPEYGHQVVKDNRYTFPDYILGSGPIFRINNSPRVKHMRLKDLMKNYDED